MSPTAAPRPCAEPRCPGLVRDRERYCPAHQRPKASGARNWYRERGGMFWFGIRRAVLQAQPLCVECLALDRVEPAREVHHVIPLSDGGANDVSNCVGLCKPHHSAHTLRETRRRGV